MHYINAHIQMYCVIMLFAGYKQKGKYKNALIFSLPGPEKHLKKKQGGGLRVSGLPSRLSNKTTTPPFLEEEIHYQHHEKVGQEGKQQAGLGFSGRYYITKK